jgi:hypothetical protein
MLVATEHRDKLALYCMITKQTQEQAGNQAIGEMLARIDGDPVLKARMDRAVDLKAALDAL